MLIKSTTSVTSNNQTRSLSNDHVKSFSKRITPASVKNAPSVASTINHDVLKTLAEDFKSGRINKEEANERFVNAVIDGSLKGKISDKFREEMTKQISDIFADDPDFMNKLQKNLRELT